MKVQLLDSMGSDLTVCDAARCSFDKESSLDDYGNLSQRDVRLINYLAEHNHFTDRKSTRLNSSHIPLSRMPSSA